MKEPIRPVSLNLKRNLSELIQPKRPPSPNIFHLPQIDVYDGRCELSNDLRWKCGVPEWVKTIRLVNTSPMGREGRIPRLARTTATDVPVMSPEERDPCKVFFPLEGRNIVTYQDLGDAIQRFDRACRKLNRIIRRGGKCRPRPPRRIVGLKRVFPGQYQPMYMAIPRIPKKPKKPHKETISHGQFN